MFEAAVLSWWVRTDKWATVKSVFDQCFNPQFVLLCLRLKGKECYSIHQTDLHINWNNYVYYGHKALPQIQPGKQTTNKMVINSAH